MTIDINDIPAGMMIAPCDCDEKTCSGWRVVPRPKERNPLLHMTRGEFVEWYEQFAGGIESGQGVVECECGHKGCVGWMVEDKVSEE